MKKINFIYLVLFIASFTNLSYAQSVIVGSPEYDQRKANGELEGLDIIQDPNGAMTVINPIINPNNYNLTPKNIICDCYKAPDATYTLALAPNDDGSSSLINIPFSFSFYGTNYTNLYINNNGNVTFGNALSGYNANAFPSASNKIIAPFWADVDTRGGNGRVVYKVTPTAIYVNWENVGYYNTKGDKRNTFQLILTNGTDPAVPNGQNVAFCYQDMQWTTGSASGGVNGFGGTPATAGANKGDNLTAFQLARFDHAGTDFYGALGAPAGISWLDNKSFFFDITNSSNIPPIPNGVSPCDTFKICSIGDTADIPILFLSPEAAQSTTITLDAGSSGAVTQVSNVPGNTATIVVRAVGTPANLGYHTVTVTATDNGVPVGVTSLSFVVWITDVTGGTGLHPSITPVGACQSATLSVLNGPYDTYLWDNLSSAPTITANNRQVYGVTVSRNGCYKRTERLVNIMPPIVANIQGSFKLCPGMSTTELYIADSARYRSISWHLPDPARDTIFKNRFPAGTYTVSLTDSAGYCHKDTTFTITQQLPLIIGNDVEQCTLNYVFTGNANGSGQGTWTVYDSPANPTFSSNTALNPTVTFPTFGNYHLVYKDKYCEATDTVHFKLVQPPYFDFDSDFFACPFETEHLVFKDSSLVDTYHWGIPIPSQDTLFTANLYQGTYTASYVMYLGCTRDTTFTIETQPLTVLHDYVQICGDTLTMSLHTGSPTGQWTTLSMPGTNAPVFGNATVLNTTLKVKDYGDYVFVYNNSCDNKDTLRIKFVPYPYFDIQNAEICLGDEYVFAVPNDPFVTSYLWNTGAQTSTLTVDKEGLYILTATNQCGIHIDSSYIAAFVCNIDFPNVFTPDGDNVNEIWTSLEHPDGFNSFSVRIVNRWGNLMYEYNNVNGGWDGKSKDGAEASEGVYFYNVVAESKNGKKLERQGFFQLVRKK